MNVHGGGSGRLRFANGLPSIGLIGNELLQRRGPGNWSFPAVSCPAEFVCFLLFIWGGEIFTVKVADVNRVKFNSGLP